MPIKRLEYGGTCYKTQQHQVLKLAKDDEVNQDLLDSGTEDEYYSSEEDYCGDGSDTQLELDDDYVVPDTQDYVLEPRSNGGQVLKIWSHFHLKFINGATITTYCI